MMRNFIRIFPRTQQASEFSRGLDPKLNPPNLLANGPRPGTGVTRKVAAVVGLYFVARVNAEVTVKGLSTEPRHTAVRRQSDSGWRCSRYSESEDGAVRHPRGRRDAPAMSFDDRAAD